MVYIVSVLSGLIAILQSLKIFIIKRNLKKLSEDFKEKINIDTNTLITVSTNDKYIRKIASDLNVQLKLLRKKYHTFCKGDSQVKNSITNISHDLRTPLTSVIGYLNLLEQEINSEKASRYISIMKERTETMKKLTEEFFSYSVVVSYEEENIILQPVVINEVLEESIASFYTTITERNIVPLIDITEEKIIRSLDRTALLRIFSNLLNNAIKYSDGDLEILLNDQGQIIFSNTASKLDEIKVGRLFERFYTVENARIATGIGLAISKELTHKMNGKISAYLKNNKLFVCIEFNNI